MSSHYNHLGKTCNICYLFRLRVTEDAAMSNSETVTYNQQARPDNQSHSHQTPTDASVVQNTSSAEERSRAVSYADPVDYLVNPNDSSVDNRLYVAPKYEDPQSFDAVSIIILHTIILCAHDYLLCTFTPFFAECSTLHCIIIS